MTQPVRLQRKRTKGWRLVSPNGLPVKCITRPGRHGNPFSPGKAGPMGRRPIDPIGALGFFEAMLSDPQLRAAAGYPSDDEIRRDLAGVNLACYCALCPRHRDAVTDALIIQRESGIRDLVAAANRTRKYLILSIGRDPHGPAKRELAALDAALAKLTKD